MITFFLDLMLFFAGEKKLPHSLKHGKYKTNFTPTGMKKCKTKKKLKQNMKIKRAYEIINFT